MKNLREELNKNIILSSPQEGMNASPIPGVQCFKISKTGPRAKNRWVASLCIITQGTKELSLENGNFSFKGGSYIATPVDLPVISQTHASSNQKPFTGIKINFDPHILGELTAQLKTSLAAAEDKSRPAIFGGDASEAMLESALRLTKLFQSPDDAAILGPLVIKELYYHLLKSPNGHLVQQFVLRGSKMHKISQTISKIRAHLNQEIDIATLAKSANMSRSVFYRNFTELTSVSPIQYQKNLRLHEARRLMLEEGETAEGAAFKVGYNSSSQFSRDYSRMFGNPPMRDIQILTKHMSRMSE